MKVQANGLDIEVVVDEPANGADAATAPTVLLVMGLGMQLIAWPDVLVRALTGAGYRVIRFDNRDIGLSQKTNARVPNLALLTIRYRLGMTTHADYTLRDMVEDARGVLDALGVARCHVVGASMGGMIAQGLAASHPDRVRSLTSIMSTTGARRLPKATPRASMAFIARPRSHRRDDVIEHFARFLAVIGSPRFPTPLSELRERVGTAYDRCYEPRGTSKQLAAIIASGDRSAEVRSITVPTLVIHGADDPLVPLENGEDTARKIRGARLEVIPGMGHDFGAIVPIIDKLLPFLRQVNGRGT
ncbi:MAG: alpha/beta hydrolase [Burkholderiales bacterium]|nr:alpha/beta hydrolase [Burkholderiales bacterium]